MDRKQPFYIAEIGLNHNGDFDLACEMVSAAQRAGASAVKFQSINARNFIANSVFNNPIGGFGLPGVKTVGDFWEKVSIDDDFHIRMNDYCKSRGIEFMSTAFDAHGVTLLDRLNVKRFKVASCDLTHYPLLKKIAETGRPIILSTGGSTLDEIRAAVEFVKKSGCKDLSLLHCISLYPTPPEYANLNAIVELKNEFGLRTGFSDHSEGIHISMGAIALGAEIIERHFTLDNSLPGPDQKLSLEPEEFSRLVEQGNHIYSALQAKGKVVSDREHAEVPNNRRSIVAARDIPEGTKLQEDDLLYKRPGTGMGPENYERVIGAIVTRNLKADEQIEPGLLKIELSL